MGVLLIDCDGNVASANKLADSANKTENRQINNSIRQINQNHVKAKELQVHVL